MNIIGIIKELEVNKYNSSYNRLIGYKDQLMYTLSYTKEIRKG